MIVRELEKLLKTLNIKEGFAYTSNYLHISKGVATVDNYHIRIFTKVKLDNGLTTCIPIKWIKSILKMLPKDSEVILTHSTVGSGEDVKHNLTLESNGASFQTITIDPEEFPKTFDGSVGTESTHILTSRDVENIKLTGLATATDQTRPALTAVYVGNDIVATNGEVLVVNGISEVSEIPYLIPSFATKHLQGGYSVKINVVEEYVTYIILTNLENTIYIRCEEGMFPNYRAVLPESYEEVVMIDRTALLKTLKAMPKSVELINFTLSTITNVSIDLPLSIPINISKGVTNEKIAFKVKLLNLITLLSSQSDDLIELGFKNASTLVKFGSGVIVPKQ